MPGSFITQRFQKSEKLVFVICKPAIHVYFYIATLTGCALLHLIVEKSLLEAVPVFFIMVE